MIAKFDIGSSLGSEFPCGLYGVFAAKNKCLRDKVSPINPEACQRLEFG